MGKPTPERHDPDTGEPLYRGQLSRAELRRWQAERRAGWMAALAVRDRPPDEKPVWTWTWSVGWVWMRHGDGKGKGATK